MSRFAKKRHLEIEMLPDLLNFTSYVLTQIKQVGKFPQSLKSINRYRYLLKDAPKREKSGMHRMSKKMLSIRQGKYQSAEMCIG